MEKIFKKSLALILSAALCLTALVGCLTVSAAEGDNTKPVYSVNSVEGAAGAEVKVVANFSEISNVCAHHVIFTFPAGLEVKAVKKADGTPYTPFNNDGDRFDYKLDVAEDDSTKVQFVDFVNWAADGLSTSDMSIHFTVKIAADAAANTEYPVTIAVQAADQEAVDLLDVTCTDGKVTVKANTHVHTWNAGVVTTEPTLTAKGVKTYTCTVCNETKTEEIPMIDLAISNLSYDHAMSKLVYRYDLGADFIAAMGAVKNLDRTVAMIVTMDEKEFIVDTSIKTFNTRNVTGFTLNDMVKDFTMKVRCTYVEGGETKTFESNVITLNISKIIDDAYASGSMSDADKAITESYRSLKALMETSTDTVDATFTEIAEHSNYVTSYSLGKIEISNSKMTFRYDQGEGFISAISAAKEKNRKLQFVVTLDGKEIELGELSRITTFANYGISGFTISDYNKSIAISMRLSYEENGETLYVNSDPVTIVIADEIAKNTTSELAIAFNNYNSLLH